MKCKVVKGNKENLKELCDLLGARSKMDLGPIIETVSGVIDDIKENGDNAVLKYTEKFDKAVLTADTMRVTAAEIDEAIKSIDPELLGIIRKEIRRPLSRLIISGDINAGDTVTMKYDEEKKQIQWEIDTPDEVETSD